MSPVKGLIILYQTVLIRGSEIFVDLMDENELAKKVMDYSYNVGIMEYDFNFTKFNKLFNWRIGNFIDRQEFSDDYHRSSTKLI